MIYDTVNEKVEVECEFRFQIFEKDGWSVTKYKAKDGKDFTACGKNLPTVKATGYRLYGRWERTEKFGMQLTVDFFEEVLPTNSKGFVAYMKSLKCGIGGIKARLIYEKFGENVWTIIDSDPMQLTAVPGVTEKSVQRLTAALQSTHLLRDVMKLFQGKVEITPTKANLLIEKFGNYTLDTIKNHTYKLCSVQGFSFPVVDKMGLSLGKSPADNERLIALVDYMFEIAGLAGNVCVPYQEYINQLERYANMGFLNHPVPREECIRVLKMQIKGGRVIYTSGMLYAEYRAFEEKESVNDLRRLMSRPQKKDPKMVETLIDEYEKANNIQLADSQKDAIKMVFSNPVSIITGGPGTGKTTIIKAILFLHKKLYQSSAPVLLAPTAKAARRMTEQSGFDATTVHSAIGYTGAEDIRTLKEQEKGTLEGNLIIVDEVSMLDQFIYTGLLAKIKTGAKLVMVGDPDQLPSVGAGEVLYQLIRSHAVPVTKLSVIFRQSQENPIVYNASQINSGNTSLIYQMGKFDFHETISDERTFLMARDLYIAYADVYGLDSVILLCPIRKKTQNHPILNVKSFNKDLQDILNPYVPGSKQIRSDDGYFRVGDKVMQTKNTPLSKNGDTGIIQDIVEEADSDDKSEKVTKVIIEFDAGNTVSFDEEGMKSIELAYATTVHKSQGSEYKTVILVCAESQERMMQRRLVYTAITRAREQIEMVGQSKALMKAIQDNTTKHRNTLLGDRLHQALAA